MPRKQAIQTRKAAAALIAPMLALTLTNCASNDDDSAGTSATSTANHSGQTDSSAEDTLSVEDDSVSQALEEAGITESDIRALSEVGDENGFILDTRSPTWEESQEFAYMSYLTCKDVELGEDTWENVRSESESTGATMAEAQAMASYWENTFCPKLDLETPPDPSAVVEGEPSPSLTTTSSSPVRDNAEFQAAIAHCDSKIDFLLKEDLESDYPWGDRGELLIEFEPRPGELGSEVATQGFGCILPQLGLSAHDYSVVAAMPSGTLAWTSDTGNEWTLNWRNSDTNHTSYYDGDLSL